MRLVMLLCLRQCCFIFQADLSSLIAILHIVCFLFADCRIWIMFPCLDSPLFQSTYQNCGSGLWDNIVLLICSCKEVDFPFKLLWGTRSYTLGLGAISILICHLDHIRVFKIVLTNARQSISSPRFLLSFIIIVFRFI